MKKVLVMGGSYFIGLKIVEILCEAGYDVYTLNRGTRKITNENVKNIICDRNKVINMKNILSTYKFDIVIDVCGLNKNQAEILCDSLDLDYVKKFVFISSSAVYDIENLSIPFSEEDNLSENVYWEQYGSDKIEAEKYYEDRLKNTNSELIILRPPYVYGENNYAQRESFIFNHIINNSTIIIPESNPKLQFIYTSDLAYIILDLLKRNNEKVSIYNVGNKEYVTVEEWVKCCFKAAGKTTDIIKYDYKSHGRGVRDFFPFRDYDNVLDVKKINSISNHETDFIEGLKKSFKWFMSVKNEINFKEDVTANEHDIIKEIK